MARIALETGRIKEPEDEHALSHVDCASVGCSGMSVGNFANLLSLKIKQEARSLTHDFLTWMAVAGVRDSSKKVLFTVDCLAI